MECAGYQVCSERGFWTTRLSGCSRRAAGSSKRILRGRDVFVSLLTGSGKSVCYGCLPFAFNSLWKSSSSIVIVISPLKALMLDQMEIFNVKGVQAIYAGDELDVKSMDNVKSGKCALLFISPEALIGGCTWRCFDHRFIKRTSLLSWWTKLIALRNGELITS